MIANFPSSLDPRSRILCAALFSIIMACANTIAAAFFGLLTGLVLLAFAWNRNLNVTKRLLAVNFFIAFLWLLVPFTTPGPVLWQWKGISLSATGLRLAILVTLKANALALIFLVMIASMPVSILGTALNRLHCPQKLNLLFLLLNRNIRILGDEWRRLQTAACLRCFRAGTNLHSYRTIASSLAFLLLNCYGRAQIMHEAMLLRGFSGKLPFCERLKYRNIDFVCWLVTFCLCSVILMLEFHGHAAF